MCVVPRLLSPVETILIARFLPQIWRVLQSDAPGNELSPTVVSALRFPLGYQDRAIPLMASGVIVPVPHVFLMQDGEPRLGTSEGRLDPGKCHYRDRDRRNFGSCSPPPMQRLTHTNASQRPSVSCEPDLCGVRARVQQNERSRMQVFISITFFFILYAHPHSEDHCCSAHRRSLAKIDGL